MWMQKRTILLALAVYFVSVSVSVAQPYDGVFTSPWYAPNGVRTSHYHNTLCQPGCASQTTAAWVTEIEDMKKAGLDFFVPYSWGVGAAPWADPTYFGPIGQAVQQAGGIKVAFMLDTLRYSEPAFGPTCGLNLAASEATVKQIFFNDGIKAWFDVIPDDAEFRVNGRPVLFLGGSYPMIRNRELLGQLLIKTRQWFRETYNGLEVYIIVGEDWMSSIPSVPGPCAGGGYNPSEWGMSQAAINLVGQQSDAMFRWSFSGTPGQKGVVTPGGYPGGGFVLTHPVTGISVGTAGVGYHYQDPSNTSNLRIRDRRNGLTLTEDWNAIRGATLRMIMAWYDYDEASNISRDQQTGYKYIDLVKQLTQPVTPTLGSFAPPSGPIRTSLAAVINVAGTKFLPGATVEVAPYPAASPVQIFQATYISPDLMQVSYGGGAPAGSYYVRVSNGDGTFSAPLVVNVQP